jgi:DNA-binding response OmpR family regulator
MTDAWRILLVMTAEHRHAVMQSLTAESWELRSASDCRQARKLLHREHFDLVITDVSLPDGNWLTISRELNQSDAPPALVVCLPYQAERVGSILGAGQVHVLMPPLEGETVRLVLEEALRGRQTPWQRFTEEPHCAPLPV